ncbi:MAG: ThuA domain-containing protein [Halioglobus sp.]|nr:ThuA domain-containing protein [Halioglobus sp.]
MAGTKSLLSKFLRVALLLLLLMGGLSFLVVWQVGAWNLVFPSHHHDTVAPEIPSALVSPSILVFSKTNSFRHVEGIAGGIKTLAAITENQHWGMFHTENGAVFNAKDLARFDAVVFLNASGDILSEEQEVEFQSWLQAGGGWLGIHSAGDDSHLAWQWYRDNLIGATFTAHILGPQFQSATVVMENHAHPVLADIPDTWEHEEEWYSWEQSPRGEGFTILASLDETSYSPEQNFLNYQRDLRMGDHPVVWTNCIGDGRSVYAAMGHTAESFEQPIFRQLITNALSWLIYAESCPSAFEADDSAITSVSNAGISPSGN